MALPSHLNDTNITCSLSLLWSESFHYNQQPTLYICIIATFIHTIFWLQFAFHSSIRQKTMQWIYAYLATDILLLLRFFFLFIVRTRSNPCTSNLIWFYFVCYLEAMFDNYLNVLEVYILLALNISRYQQIVHNRNVYTTYVRSTIVAHVGIYLVPLIIMIIQFCIHWADLVIDTGGSCNVWFTNTYSQALNTAIGFALPILLNIFVICRSVQYVRVTSRLRRGQQKMSAREKYNRSLVIQFLAFYTVWLLLWSPNVIVYQFTSITSTLTTTVSQLNFIEIALDPFIIGALDARFRKVWYSLWLKTKRILLINDTNQIRVAPATIRLNTAR